METKLFHVTVDFLSAKYRSAMLLDVKYRRILRAFNSASTEFPHSNKTKQISFLSFKFFTGAEKTVIRKKRQGRPINE